MNALQSGSLPTRDAILDAAEAIFATVGYEGATFSRICREAGVSRGLPSYLFGSKDELYRAVVNRSAQRLRDAVIEPLRQCGPATPIEEAIERIVTTYVDYLAANATIVRLLQWELLADPAGTRPFAPASALFGDLLEILQAVLQEQRCDIDARAALGNIVALCFFPFMLGERVAPLGATGTDTGGLARRKHQIVSLLNGGLRCLSN